MIRASIITVAEHLHKSTKSGTDGRMKAIKTSKNNPQRKKSITSKKLSVANTKKSSKKISVFKGKNIKKIKSFEQSLYSACLIKNALM
jgi:hypothetical protein